MKKLLLVLAIGAFVACNNSGTSTESAAPDSPAVKTDSPAVVVPDSPAVVGDTSKPADTLKK